MPGEKSGSNWADRAARHPNLLALLEKPFDELLRDIASELLDEPSVSSEDPSGHMSANGVKLRFAGNNHATESVLVLRSRWAVAAVYQSDYKGVIGKVIEPVPSWGISVDKDDGRYYWSEARHGDSPGMFVCGLGECDELPEGSTDMQEMHWYLSLAIYARDNPEAAEFGHSEIPPLDLKARLGLLE